MKKSLSFPVVAGLILLSLAAFASRAAAVAPGEAVFCKDITEKWEPVEPGAESDTNVVNCLFRGKQAFGAMEIVLSIYLAEKNGQQALLHREKTDVSPSWTAMYLRGIPLPGVGRYVFVLSSVSGEVISSGEVTVKEKTVEKPIPEKNKMDGTTLEGLFNKFKEQVKQ